MIIRNMKEEDLEYVCKIENETFSHPWKLHDFQSSINNQDNIYLVVQEAEKVIAYCGLWGVSGEGQINNVAVEKKFQNMHIGYQMLNELIILGKNSKLDSFTLEVRVSNLSAIKLYHKLGFRDSGIRKDFYDNPKEDALIMWL